MKKAVATLVALSALAGCGGGGSEAREQTTAGQTETAATATVERREPEQSASDFMTDVVEWNLNAQFGRVWPHLHPKLQALTTRADWEACLRKKADERAGIKVLRVEAIDEYSDPQTAPGVGRVDAVAVTVRMKFTLPILEDSQEVTDTVYVMNVNGEWKGLWDQATYEAYRAGTCPD